MTTLLLLATIASSQAERPLFPPDAPYKDRAGFHQALSKVNEGMTSKQVKKLLGTPDDVLRGKQELDGTVGDEIWCYGTDKHLAFPTLGTVTIAAGKVYTKPPYTYGRTFRQVAPERELRSMLRKLYVSESKGLSHDPLWTIRTANTLIDAGREKAVFAVEEFCQAAGYINSSQPLSNVLRLAFVVPPPSGYPEDWKPNAFLKELKPSFRREARFPMIVRDDIPFYFDMGGQIMTGGGWIDIDFYRKYPLRSARLTPPADPFQSYLDLLASDEWPFPAHTKDEERFSIKYEEDEGDALEQVLRLVRDVYQPVDFRSEFGINGLDFEKYYQGFKALGARWDDSLQRYVRADGVRLAEKQQPPEQYWYPPDYNNLKVDVSLARNGVSDYVNTGYFVEYKKGARSLPEVVRFINASTGKVIAWMAVNSKGSLYEAAPRITQKAEANFLAGPLQKLLNSAHSATVGLTIPLNTPVRVELVTRSRRIVGPILKP